MIFSLVYWNSCECENDQLRTLRLIYRNRFAGVTGGWFIKRRNLIKHRFRVSAELLGPGKPQYHPFEEIVESSFPESGEARLTAAETTRTIIEVRQIIFTLETRRKVHSCQFISYVLLDNEHYTISSCM